MPFGLKNTSVIYQRAMNAIFHEFIGNFMEIYIDDIVVKSDKNNAHLNHLRKAFEKNAKAYLKMNPLSCVFNVATSNFLRFIVHEKGDCN